jgi:hypothetical protein
MELEGKGLKFVVSKELGEGSRKGEDYLTSSFPSFFNFPRETGTSEISFPEIFKEVKFRSVPNAPQN